LAAAAVVASIVIGLLAGAVVVVNVHRLSQLSDTLLTSAEALDQTAEGLDDLRRAPFIGGRIGKVADNIGATASSARENAERSRKSVLTLGYVLGGLIAAIPAVPTLVAYLIYRALRQRDAVAVRHALATSENPQLLRRYLALRALARLPYRDVVALGSEPWREAAEGHYAHLAATELARLGIEETDPSR